MKKTLARNLAAAILLLAVIAAAFWPLAGNDFLAFDDDVYVTENRALLDLPPGRAAAWAFTGFGYSGNWHPLTWLSHLLDLVLFGLRPAGHHLMSLGLHAAASLMLGGILRAATGAFWPSLLVAALFAVHPLHVESVAWVAERKDVLSALFWVAAMAAYIGYVRRPGRARYAVVVLAFVLGLMSKPMAVTLPFVLLLLDWWPLGRMGTGRLLLEKIPLLALSAAGSWAAWLAQSRAGATARMLDLPFGLRLANALTACLDYLRQTLWPAGLAVFYPHPGESLPAWKVGLAAVLLAAVSAAALRLARRQPHLVTGWFWYLGTLVPVIGLVQIGGQARADRYTYLPLVGLFLAAAWSAAALVRPRPRLARAAGSLGLLLIALLAAAARVQVGHWRNGVTLFRHNLEVVGDDWLVRFNLGIAYSRLGREDEAVRQYRRSLELMPDDADTENNLGNALLALGRVDEAAAHMRRAIRLNPRYARAFNSLGAVLAGRGDTDGAVRFFKRAADLDPGLAEARYNLARQLEDIGRKEEAAGEYLAYLRLRPGDRAVRRRLARLRP